MTGKKGSEGSEPEDGLRANGNPAELRCRTEKPLPRKDGDIFSLLQAWEIKICAEGCGIGDSACRGRKGRSLSSANLR